MNTNDYYLAAVSYFQESNRNLKAFAEACSHVSEKKTLALAQDCGCSYETVNGYRNAYLLQVELSALYPAKELWGKSYVGLWVKASQLRSSLNLSNEKTWDYLLTAVTEKMSRKTFAAHVDEKENDTPKWIRRLRQAIRFLTPSKDDYKSEMPPELQTRYDAAVTTFVTELEAIAAESETL